MRIPARYVIVSHSSHSSVQNETVGRSLRKSPCRTYTGNEQLDLWGSILVEPTYRGERESSRASGSQMDIARAPASRSTGTDGVAWYFSQKQGRGVVNYIGEV